MAAAAILKKMVGSGGQFLARLLIKKGGLLQLKFGVGINIYLRAR